MSKQAEPEKYLMQNVLSPRRAVRVEKAKFDAMKEAILAVLPAKAPGMTPAELMQHIKPILSNTYFPGGEKAGWWMKGVQLDLEAKGVIARDTSKPVRLYRAR